MNDDQPLEPAEAWMHIRDLMHIIVSSFGLPHQIAAMVLLTRRTRAHILQWLTAAEALARRMLLIHAAALPKPNALPPDKAKRINTSATHGRRGFANDDSEKWSVSFRVAAPLSLSRLRESRSITRAARRRTFKQPDARPIAERIEALIRVCAAPEAYAKRLARRLHAAPARALFLIKPIRWKNRANPAGAMLHQAEPLARAAINVFADSS